MKERKVNKKMKVIFLSILFMLTAGCKFLSISAGSTKWTPKVGSCWQEGPSFEDPSNKRRWDTEYFKIEGMDKNHTYVQSCTYMTSWWDGFSIVSAVSCQNKDNWSHVYDEGRSIVTTFTNPKYKDPTWTPILCSDVR